MRLSFLMMALAGIGALVAMGLVPSPPSYTGMPMVLFLLYFVVSWTGCRSLCLDHEGCSCWVCRRSRTGEFSETLRGRIRPFSA